MPMSPQFSPAQIRRMQKLYNKHLSCRAVAEIMGCNATTVNKYVKTRSVKQANKGAHLRWPVKARHPKRSPKWRKFESIAAAARATRLPSKTVGNMVNGVTKSTKSGWEFQPDW